MTSPLAAPPRPAGAYLALADGRIFPGQSVGAHADVPGEAVFNTGMTGYQEILSDPSYAGQFVCLTAPEIGIAGVNREDMESDRFHAAGLLAHRVSAPSNWRSEEALATALARRGVPALAGLDTRALTLHLRDHGPRKAFLCATGAVPPDEGVARARAWAGLDGQDYATRVTCEQTYLWEPDAMERSAFPRGAGPVRTPDRRVVVYDFGVKRGILRSLWRAGLAPTVVPAATDAETVLSLAPDGVVLSNGPGDPAAVGYAVRAVRRLLGRVPLFGICLGHQLLGLACGGKTYRLPFGHHGANHPVRTLADGRVAVASHNHNFALDAASLDPERVEITHVSANDGTVEGLRCRAAPAFSVQFHPEACPGPRDALGLFAAFRALVDAHRG